MDLDRGRTGDDLGRTRRELDCALICAEIALTFGDRVEPEKTTNDNHLPSATNAPSATVGVAAAQAFWPHDRHVQRLKTIGVTEEEVVRALKRSKTEAEATVLAATQPLSFCQSARIARFIDSEIRDPLHAGDLKGP